LVEDGVFIQNTWLAYRDAVQLAFAVHLLSPTARERGSEPTINVARVDSEMPYGRNVAPEAPSGVCSCDIIMRLFIRCNICLSSKSAPNACVSAIYRNLADR
jgi:hypothetical protein